MPYVFIAFVVILLAFGAVFAIKRNNGIQQNGIEADAVVSRVEEKEDTDGEGNRNVAYEYYVEYQTQDGKSVEAKLGNAPEHAVVGSWLRIKYLPEKPKYVIPA